MPSNNDTTLVKILPKPFTLTPSDPSYFFFSFSLSPFPSFILLRSSSEPSPFLFSLFPYVYDYRTIRTWLFSFLSFFPANTSTRWSAPAERNEQRPYTHATAIKEQKFVNLFVSRRIVKNRRRCTRTRLRFSVIFSFPIFFFFSFSRQAVLPTVVNFLIINKGLSHFSFFFFSFFLLYVSF